ncbi:MAG: NACHT domain-containing protein, partial [Actinomycetes bacterium]
QIFARRSVESHVDELAQNPMQLSILLLLIHQRLESLPRKRTDLYTDYMKRFLDREAKDPIVREHRDPLEEVVSYLAWYLHSQAEQGGGNGRLAVEELKRLMRHYLVDNQLDHRLVDALFSAATTRVWVLTSRRQGLFEFDVQPVREYFAAKYLAEYHPSGRRGGGDKSTRFGEIAAKPYWLNATRFLAGFFTRTELADLSDDLIQMIQERPGSFFIRRLARHLIQDEVFTERPQALHRLVDGAFDTLGQRILLHDLIDNRSSHVPQPAAPRLGSTLRNRLEVDPSHLVAVETATLLRAIVTEEELGPWWLNQVTSASPPVRDHWFKLAPHLGAGRGLTPAQTDQLLADHPEQATALVAAGADATPKSDGERRLLAAVLAGQVTGWDAQGSGMPALVAQAFDPDRFLVRTPISAQSRTRNASSSREDWPPNHRSDLGSARRKPANKLGSTRPEWAAAVATLRLHAGQSGTTALWQDAARALVLAAGYPNWLSREIAVMAAASTELRTGGTNPRGSQPFGEHADPAALIEAVRRHRGDRLWWSTTRNQLHDQLDQATWALAHLLCADQILTADLTATLNGLSPELQGALHRASLRIGSTGRVRRLPVEVAMSLATSDPRTAALLAHQLSRDDRALLLRRMNPSDRLSLATDLVLGVPLIESAARTSGMTDVVNLQLLRAVGPLARLTARVASRDLSAVLAEPEAFPWGAVALAENVRGLRRVN